MHRIRCIYRLVDRVFGMQTLDKNVIFCYCLFDDPFLTLHGTNSFFHRYLGYNLRVGSCRLPTHSLDANRKFFRGSLHKMKSKFWLNSEFDSLGSLRLF